MAERSAQPNREAPPAASTDPLGETCDPVRSSQFAWSGVDLNVLLEDYELIAEQLSELGGKVGPLENRVSDLLLRMADVTLAWKRPP